MPIRIAVVDRVVDAVGVAVDVDALQPWVPGIGREEAGAGRWRCEGRQRQRQIPDRIL